MSEKDDKTGVNRLSIAVRMMPKRALGSDKSSDSKYQISVKARPALLVMPRS